MYRFPLEHTEQIIKKDLATLHIDRVGLTGALYLTNERLVFVGYEVGVVFKMVKAFSLMQIREIKAGKTMFIIPNALEITIENNERLKIIIQGRDTWLTAIREGVVAAGREQTSEGNTPAG
jgi:stage V sporulation protein SpoVS